jgi:hypothetical protein
VIVSGLIRFFIALQLAYFSFCFIDFAILHDDVCRLSYSARGSVPFFSLYQALDPGHQALPVNQDIQSSS